MRVFSQNQIVAQIFKKFYEAQMFTTILVVVQPMVRHSEPNDLRPLLYSKIFYINVFVFQVAFYHQTSRPICCRNLLCLPWIYISPHFIFLDFIILIICAIFVYFSISILFSFNNFFFISYFSVFLNLFCPQSGQLSYRTSLEPKTSPVRSDSSNHFILMAGWFL